LQPGVLGGELFRGGDELLRDGGDLLWLPRHLLADASNEVSTGLGGDLF